jgi:tetratricopeptide (TPR) repeat protein
MNEQQLVCHSSFRIPPSSFLYPVYPVHPVKFLIILTLLTTFIPFGVRAQQQPSSQGRSIIGRAHQADGESAAWLIVRLLNAGGEPLTLAVTDHAGEFSFGGLGETSYRVVIQAAGRQTATARIDFNVAQSAARSNNVRTVELTLVLAGSGAQLNASRTAFTQSVPKAARDSFERAMRLGQAGRKQVAHAMMQEAIKIFPDYFDAHFALSSELVKAGRLNEAITELEEAIRINPRDDRVYQSFGIIMMRQGKFEVAAAVFAEAARLNGAEPLHPLMRGNALIDYASNLDASRPESAKARVRAFQEAERELLSANEKSNGRLSSVHLQLARLYQKRGERERAAAELDQYLMTNPSAKNADEIRDIIRRLRTPADANAPSAPPQ